MSAKDDSELQSPSRDDNEPQHDATNDYCAQWLATVSAAQHDEADHLSQEQPFQESQSQEPISNHQDSPQAVRTSSHCATHHRTESRALRPATPSSPLSHMAPTPEPEPESLATVSYSDSLRLDAGETSRYEKKPRRKTRPDRYDTSRQHRETTTLSRRERRDQKREKLRSRKEIVTNFYSSAVENRHVLLKPSLATGAFVNGRGSVPTPLSDLTFNELTFPITQKSAIRTASPQPTNGARKHHGVQVPTAPEQIERNSQESRVVEICPATPTPLPRQDSENALKQQQSIDTGGDTARNEPARLEYPPPRPIVRYVDSGVDTMSPVGNSTRAGSENGQHTRRPAAELQPAEQTNLFAPYYYPLPVYMPQYYEPSYRADGIHEPAGQLSNSDWPEHGQSHCPSRHIYSTPMQSEILDYYGQNKDYSCIAPISNMYPAPPNSLNEDILSSPVHEPQPLFKPDEESKAFWRPNFLR